jgi:DNA topoisomerase-3
MPQADLDALPDGERKTLYMLAIRLVCAVENQHTFAETAVTLECGGYPFAAKGRTIISKGWTLYEQLFRNWIKHKVDDEDEQETALPEIIEGQVFKGVIASVKEGFTSPPKRFTEDTLLSGMESAGSEYTTEDEIPSAERKGLGTPATRANVIEKLIKSGFMERRKKSLVPTQKGVNLIAILPEAIKSPLLTAEWEHKLSEIERGRLSPDNFMEGIADMTRALVTEHTAADPMYAGLFTRPPSGEIAGSCPRCGKPVRENKKAFSCEDRACGFVMWKDNKFFAAKKKILDIKTAAALLKDGRIFMSGLFSEKTGKTYDAFIVLEDTGKFANFKIEFKDGGRKCGERDAGA